MYLKCIHKSGISFGKTMLYSYTAGEKGDLKMFKVDNKKIGEYLQEKIEKKFVNTRRFCKEFVKMKNLEPNDDEIRKAHNRFSQIEHGIKSIQISDLPIVCDLLGLTCEQILSAGAIAVPKNEHMTNYSVAASKDQQVWEDYINRGDVPILNFDEYGNNILDYAYEFGNYDFLSYLFKKGYIEFKEENNNGLEWFYGAKTNIHRREPFNTDGLRAEMEYSDKLRYYMVLLAMRKKDYSMLNNFRAREVPMMHYVAFTNNEFSDNENYDFSKIVPYICTSKEVLDYFSDEYVIIEKYSKKKCYFIYQHLDKVIDTLIRKGDKKVLPVIHKAAEHNKKVLHMINEVKNDVKEYYYELIAIPRGWSREEFDKRYHINPQSNKTHNVKYDTVNYSITEIDKSIVSNLISVHAKSDDLEISKAVQDLKSTYERVILEFKGDR